MRYLLQFGFAVAIMASCTAARASESIAPAATSSPAPQASAFKDWAGVIVAADNHSHSGKYSPAFDNARRDVASAFAAAGFVPGHLRQFSVDPTPEGETTPGQTSADTIRAAMHVLLADAGAGCLFYFTSHGDRAGIMFDNRTLSPKALNELIERTCGARPTVVIVSACYSGVFVGPLAAPNRMIMTAARPDRSSFGCGDGDKYPYFDACMIQEIPHAASFPALANQVKACVTAKETAKKFKPASEPQLSIGGGVAPLLSATHFSEH